jgi:hypothetical protein
MHPTRQFAYGGVRRCKTASHLSSKASAAVACEGEDQPCAGEGAGSGGLGGGGICGAEA